MKITREQRDALDRKVRSMLYETRPGMPERAVDIALRAVGIEVEQPPKQELPEGPLRLDWTRRYVLGGNGLPIIFDDAFLTWAMTAYNAERPWEEKREPGEATRGEGEVPTTATYAGGLDCGECGQVVEAGYYWWTKNPVRRDALPLHQECAAKYYGW